MAEEEERTAEIIRLASKIRCINIKTFSFILVFCLKVEAWIQMELGGNKMFRWNWIEIGSVFECVRKKKNVPSTRIQYSSAL